MQQQARHQAWIFLAAATLFFAGLGSTHLWDKDETIYSSCALEMFQRHDWVVPTFNNSLFPDKPALMYWLMIAGFESFGVNEFAVRFWSAVLGVATALVTYHIGRLLFCPKVGLWAGLAVACNIIFTVSARAATVDSALTFCATLGMCALIVGMKTSAKSGPHSGTDSDACPLFAGWPGWRSLILLYTTMGLGFLAKGPVGLVLPLATAGAFLLIVSARQTGNNLETGHDEEAAPSWFYRWAQVFHPRNIFITFWRMRPLTAVVVVLLIAAPWYILVGIRTDGEWLRKFFVEQNMQRALRPFDNHGGSLFYHILAVNVGLFPWSVFTPGAVIQTVRALRSGDKNSSSYLLLTCWVGVYLVFWSLVSTKLPHYLLPAYPAMAVMIAAFIQQRMTKPASMSLMWARYAAVWLLGIGITTAIALPLVARIYVPGEELLGLVGVVPFLGGVWCLIWFERRRPELALRGFVITSVAFLLAVFTFAAQRVDRHQTAPFVLNVLRQRGDDTRDLVAHRFLRESYVFYAGHPINVCDDLDNLGPLMADQPTLRLLTTSESLESIETAYPGRFDEIARTARFLRDGDVVVLAPITAPDISDISAADEIQQNSSRMVHGDVPTTVIPRSTETDCESL